MTTDPHTIFPPHNIYTPMSLNQVMERLRPSERALQDQPKAEPGIDPADQPAAELLVAPTLRDLATALYRQDYRQTCRNCLRRERGDCPSRIQMPKTCLSFRLNSRQMQTYGQHAQKVLAALRIANAMLQSRLDRQKMIKTLTPTPSAT